MIKQAGYLLAGIFFGFSLSRSGATDYDLMYQMFTGQDFRIALLIGTAIVVGAMGMIVLQFLGNKNIQGDEILISKKPFNKYTVIGGSLFGIGWGLSGACPGTTLAQIGEGKVLGLAVFLGILCGTYLYAWLAENNPAL